MNHCVRCQKETRNPRFCSRPCAASYNNSQRVRTNESKTKTSKSMKSYVESNSIVAKLKYATNGFNQRGKRWAKAPDETWLSYRKAANFYTPHYLLPKIEGYELVEQLGWYHKVHNREGASRDHMYSAKEGWLNNVPIEVIKHPANCKIIPILENKSKGKKCSITLEELYQRISNWRD